MSWVEESAIPVMKVQQNQISESAKKHHKPMAGQQKTTSSNHQEKLKQMKQTSKVAKKDTFRIASAQKPAQVVQRIVTKSISTKRSDQPKTLSKPIHVIQAEKKKEQQLMEKRKQVLEMLEKNPDNVIVLSQPQKRVNQKVAEKLVGRSKKFSVNIPPIKDDLRLKIAKAAM
jgi:hypothetical protein